VKSADDILLLAKEKKMVPDTLDRLIYIELHCEMEINVEETEVMKNPKITTPNAEYDRSRQLKMWIISTIGFAC
jgi:hypothetical protein